MSKAKKNATVKGMQFDLDLKTLRAEIRRTTINSVAKNYLSFGELVKKDAEEWTLISARDKWKIVSAYLDLMIAEYQLWLIEGDLDIAAGKILDPKLNASLGYITATGLSFNMRGGGLAAKLRAIGGGLEEVTGLPFDFLLEFFFDEFDDMLKALQEMADEKVKNGKNTDRYRNLERRLMEIAERIFDKLKGPAIRNALVDKLGLRTAKRLLKKLALKLIPFVGWLDFIIDLIKALKKFGKEILDP